MGFIERLEKSIAKLEKKIAKEQMRIQRLAEKCESKKITKADFNIKKRECDERIKGYSTRIRTLQGGITKEDMIFSCLQR